MSRAFATLALALLAGCGGPGTFNGTVASNPLVVRDAVFSIAKDGQGNAVYAQLVISDVADLCGVLKANRNPKGATSLAMTLYRVSAAAVVAPDVGEYSVASTVPLVSTGSWASAAFTRNDPNCTNMVPDKSAAAKSGLVKIDSYLPQAGGILSGVYQLTFGDQADRAVGGFNASFCDWAPATGRPLDCE